MNSDDIVKLRRREHSPSNKYCLWLHEYTPNEFYNTLLSKFQTCHTCMGTIPCFTTVIWFIAPPKPYNGNLGILAGDIIYNMILCNTIISILVPM